MFLNSIDVTEHLKEVFVQVDGNFLHLSKDMSSFFVAQFVRSPREQTV